MTDRFKKELEWRGAGKRFVIGVDEVGRGPLAGPVVAAAVTFFNHAYLESNLEDLQQQDWWNEITDSKKLAQARREALAEKIREHGTVFVGVATVAEIEQCNILQATYMAMQRAVSGLNIDTNNQQAMDNDDRVILVDGNSIIPKIKFTQEAIVKGDGLVHSIAAASIVAKVARDKMMTELSKEFPQYGFEQHKGYGTAQHIQAVKEFGLTPIHRPSFCTNFI